MHESDELLETYLVVHPNEEQKDKRHWYQERSINRDREWRKENVNIMLRCIPLLTIFNGQAGASLMWM